MGTPKAWLPIGGEVLLQRVVRIVSTRAEVVVVSAAEGQELPSLPRSVEIVRDPTPGRGPLQGLAVGLARLVGRVVWAFATGTDAPMLEPGWIDLLIALGDEAEMVVPHVGDRDHPLSAIYRPEVAAPRAEEMLRRDCLRLRELGDLLRSRRVSERELRQVDPELRTLRNLNEPSDYREMLESIAGQGGQNDGPETPESIQG